MPARAQLIERFVQEERLSPRIRIEGFLLVALGIKPLSLLTIPGELPDGEQLGLEIDSLYRSRQQTLQKQNWWQRTRWQLQHFGQRPVTWKRQLVRDCYQQVVESAEAYQALLYWARAFGLRTFFWEVRPTVRELYLFRSPSVEEELHALMAERQRLKEELHRRATPKTPLSLLIYPEEQSPDYLAKLGRLLGYPACCIKAYRDNRAEEINVETRAAYQLLALPEQERAPWAYFTKSFFPCSPECEQATGLGKHAFGELSVISQQLGQQYDQLLQENRNMVLAYPELINQHVNQLTARGQSLLEQK